jgi:hypothetical protein
MTAPMIAAWSLDPVLRITLHTGLALLLLSAAGHKLRAFSAFKAALAGYDLISRRWLAAVSLLVVGLELVTGLSLLLPRAFIPALAAAALLATYTFAIAINLRRGRRDIDCGCAGPARRVPLGPGLVGRNVLLIAAALIAALPVAPRSLVWLDAVTVFAGVAMLALLYSAGDTALANAAWMRAAHHSLLTEATES